MMPRFITDTVTGPGSVTLMNPVSIHKNKLEETHVPAAAEASNFEPSER
jgi:hypothetical protein